MSDISIPKLAEKWGVSRSHLYNMANRKHDPLPVHRIGARRVVNVHEATMWRNRETRRQAA